MDLEPNPNLYYYVNGKISSCRRCKRKRTLDEDPDHLQFKTCYRCRMIERDQKKFNLSKKNYPDSFANPSKEEIVRLAEHLKASTTKQFTPTATSAPTKISLPVQSTVNSFNSNLNRTLNNNNNSNNNNNGNFIINNNNNHLPGTYQFKSNVNNLPPKQSFVTDPLTFQNQTLDQTLALLENTELQLDDDTVDVDLAYNEQLFSFNILSIDPKLNPLTLTEEQQSLLQLSFLAKYHHDQSSNYKVAAHALSPTQSNLCLYCKANLPKPRIPKQICTDCENKQSILKDFNHYLTILKLNRTQDLYRIIFMSNVPLEALLKSSLSDNKSSQNVLRLLYDKYVVPINKVANSEFLLPNDTASESNGHTGNTTTYDSILKKVLKCASDHSSTASFTDSAIDPEALSLSNNETVSKTSSIPAECKFSQLCLNYDMNTGDLVISFSHSCHL